MEPQMSFSKFLLSSAMITALAACTSDTTDDYATETEIDQTETVTADSDMSMENNTMDQDEMMDNDMMDDEMAGERGEVMTRDVMSPDGENIGTVTLTALGTDGTEVRLDVSGLEQGTHALHFHQTGKCEGPDFSSAGGHYNPTNMEHGFETDGGPHAGDMRNIDVGLNGEGVFTIVNERVSIRQANSELPALMDADGSALIIHKQADDYTSQPSGAAGARVGCAVIAP